MAINLATKYSDKIAQKFTHASYVQGKCSSEWDFSGVKGIKIYTPQTVEPVDYTRSGTSRYGTPTDMQDTIQELTMTQDKSFSLVIDKGDNSEQMMIKNAGKMMSLQTSERVVPMVDKYALNVFAHNAGKIVALSSALAKNTIVSAVFNAEEYMTDNLVPENDRYLYISGKAYNLLRQSDEFLHLEGTGVKALEKGVVGEIAGFKIVRVPTTYLPAGVNFIACYKNSVLLPYKIRETKIHQDPPGISGALLEGRSNYDAFVIGERVNGVYTNVTSSETTVAVAPSISISSHSATIASSGSSKIYYTTDGTDPRFSSTRKLYSSAVDVTAGTVVKAYAEVDGGFRSDVTTEEDN